MVGRIDDIAKAAQVSKSTVSNVLNGRMRVSERLRKRVLEASKMLDFPTGQWKQTEQHLETKVVSITLNIEGEKLYSVFEQNLLKGILTVCDKNDYYLLVKTNHLKNSQQNQFPIDGEIILNPETNSFFHGSVPHVWIGTPPLRERERIPFVDNDNELIGYTITEYLIARGHKCIAFINSLASKTVSHSRKYGYEQALTEYQLMDKGSLHFFLESEEEYYSYVYGQTKDLIQDEDHPIDAMIVNSDLMAQAVYQACEDLKKSIPDDLSVVAIYADGQSSETFAPPLTTVELNEYKLGVESAKLLLSIVGYEKTSGGGAIVPTSIIEKKSVKQTKGE